MKKLLIIDVQKQFKDNEGSYEKCLSFITENINNYDMVYATIFSQTINGETNSNYREKLKWEDCDSCTEADLEIVSTNNINIILKNGYGIKNIDRFFKKDDEIDIIGCDVDACIMAVCFQLWDRDINFRILTDYIYTTASNFTKSNVIKILKRNFGTCVVEDSTQAPENTIISKERILHMHGVAEYMYRNAAKYNLDKNEMYVVGLLHDIGYLFGKANHPATGSQLLKDLGFIYSDDISLHGDIPKSPNISNVLKLLLEADLTIGKDGTLVGYKNRLKDIGIRLGFNSEAYNIAKETVDFLENN